MLGQDQQAKDLAEDLVDITATHGRTEHRRVRPHVRARDRLAQDVCALEVTPLFAEIPASRAERACARSASHASYSNITPPSRPAEIPTTEERCEGGTAHGVRGARYITTRDRTPRRITRAPR